MTGCIVYVYDDKLFAVTSESIDIFEYDVFCEILDYKGAARLGPNEFGAKLTLPNPPEPIVILVDDTSGYFAPISLGYLNGRETARLDVTLYALPQSAMGRGGGSGGWSHGGGLQPPPRFSGPGDNEVLSMVAIARQIDQQVKSKNWSNSEALAVQSLAETTLRAMSWSKFDSMTEKKVSRWHQQLESLGVPITRAPFSSMERRDSSPQEAYANRDIAYLGSRYGRAQERGYDYEPGQYGPSPRRDYSYDYDRYGASQERDNPYWDRKYGESPQRDNPYGRDRYGARGEGRQRSDYEYGQDRFGSGEERGWWDRASDAVAEWFGDEEAERRRRMDQQRNQYRGRGPKGYRRSDERIKEDANDRLSDGYLDASDIEVTVENSELVLTGTVNSRAEKRRAEDIVESIAGVTNVENRLRVKQSMVEEYRAREYGSTEIASKGYSGTGYGSTGSVGTTSGTNTASATAESGTTKTRATPGRGRTATD